jgi:GT2 family glycosyltransferase
MKVDVVLVTNLKNSRHLAECLTSLHNLERRDFQLHFHIGLTSDSTSDLKTLEMLLEKNDPRLDTEKNENLRVKIIGSQSHPGNARNQMMIQNQSDWILFVDDDVTVPPLLLSHFSLLIQKFPNVSVFGGPNVNPAGSSYFQELSGIFFSNPFYCGPFAKRYRSMGGITNGKESNLILCGLFVKKREFLKALFPENFVCAEENHLLINLHKLGLSMLWSPDLIFFHQRRKNLQGFCQQLYKYGRGRAQFFATLPAQTFHTSLFALSIPFLMMAGFIHFQLWVFAVSVHTTVGFLWTYVRTKSFLKSLLCTPLFAFGCLSYGLGFWTEIATVLATASRKLMVVSSEQ